MSQVPKSQAKTGKASKPANVQVGDLVYVKCDGDKHRVRDKYIITAKTKDKIHAKKLIGSQFRDKEYVLKYTEVYPVPIKCVFPAEKHTVKTDPYASDSDDSSVENGEGPMMDINIEEEDNNQDLALPDEPQEELDLIPVGDQVQAQDVDPAHIDMSEDSENSVDEDQTEHSEETDSHVEDLDNSSASEQNVDNATGRPRRACKPPSYLKDYVSNVSDSD